MSYKRWLLIVILFVPIALTPPPLAAQDSLAMAAEDLKGIRAALDRLVLLQETDRRQREMELVLKRIELRERRLGPLETRLQHAEVDLRNNEEQLKSLESMRVQHKDRLAEEIKDGTDARRSETRRMLDDIDRTMDSVTERGEDSTTRLRQLEDEIADQKEEIEILDEMLAELLE